MSAHSHTHLHTHMHTHVCTRVHRSYQEVQISEIRNMVTYTHIFLLLFWSQALGGGPQKNNIAAALLGGQTTQAAHPLQQQQSFSSSSQTQAQTQAAQVKCLCVYVNVCKCVFANLLASSVFTWVCLYLRKCVQVNFLLFGDFLIFLFVDYRHRVKLLPSLLR